MDFSENTSRSTRKPRTISRKYIKISKGKIHDFMKTKHNLSFLVAQYDTPIEDGIDWMKFRVGTCDGLFSSSDTQYLILEIRNIKPGNGHLTDVFEWFGASCKRDNKDLVVMDFFANRKFQDHLVKKRGFEIYEKEHVIKKFRE